MTDPLLQEVEITNFRSIKGSILAPLDTKVVLIHGENGAGKTSVLTAIEMALTGHVLSLNSADPNYSSQLLHARPTVVTSFFGHWALRATTTSKRSSPEPGSIRVKSSKARCDPSSARDATSPSRC